MGPSRNGLVELRIRADVTIQREIVCHHEVSIGLWIRCEMPLFPVVRCFISNKKAQKFRGFFMSFLRTIDYSRQGIV